MDVGTGAREPNSTDRVIRAAIKLVVNWYTLDGDNDLLPLVCPRSNNDVVDHKQAVPSADAESRLPSGYEKNIKWVDILRQTENFHAFLVTVIYIRA